MLGEAKMHLRFIRPAFAVLIVLCVGTPARAGSQFLASNGADSSSCTRTAPCQQIGQAVLNAQPNDKIVCLDSVISFSWVIDKSIDIDCSGGRLVIRDTANNGAGLQINIPVSAGDPSRTVRLRGISINGALPTGKILNRGIDIVSAAVVYIDQVVVSDTITQGIMDRRTGGQTRLYISDSTIRGSGGPGILAAAAATGIVVLDNVRSQNNAYGIAVATGNHVMINRSVFSGNGTAGVEGDPGAQIVVNNSTISHNDFGVQSTGSVRLSNNDIAFNNTAIQGVTGTFGNNRLSGNVSLGNPLSALGPATPDLGQQ
jgi:hypothetical protein